MKALLKIISFIGLALTVIPAFLVFHGSISLETCQHLMLAGTLCWFLTAPYWMNQKSDEPDRQS